MISIKHEIYLELLIDPNKKKRIYYLALFDLFYISKR